MDNARESTSRLLDLLRREQGAMADFLIALAEFDRKRLWAGLGYTSIFYFLHRELKLSSGAAYHRKSAAELIQRFPEVVEPLRDGRLCLSSVCELARVITPENRSEVLPRFFHASKQEAKAVAAEIAPREVVPHRMVVTPVLLPQARVLDAGPIPSSPPAASPALDVGQSFHPGETLEPIAATAPSLAAVTSAPSRTPPPTTHIVPLTADARRLHLTVSKRFLAKLDAARDALSHSHPGAEADAILEAGLDLLIERAAKRRGVVERPRAATATPSADARQVAAHVRRAVWLRDEGKCQWKMADGGVCGSTHRLQLDHVVPVARGGRATADNLRLLCADHNDLAARRVFGDKWMDRFRRSAS